VIDREDLAQEVQLDALERQAAGRNPRRSTWVRTDAIRRAWGRPGKRAHGGDPDVLAAGATQARDETFAQTPLERAMRVALGLPDAQREIVVRALRCCSPRRAEDRVRAWLELHPGRRATHETIARECELRRETVTKLLSRLRAKMH
jgi:DNA-directed RNA polymerase specialized sigma24 family protein